MSIRTRAVVLAALSVILPLGALSVLPASAHAVLPPGGVAPAAKTETTSASSDAESQTKTLTRNFFDSSGNATSSSNTVTVHIDRHSNIQNDERIKVSWSGAHPTGGRAVNPYGSGGMEQEYPVLLMECRGNAQTVTPQTCWTSTFDQRTQTAPTDPTGDQAVWLDDADNTADDDQTISGLTADQLTNLPADCQPSSDSAAHITPFVAVSGKVYYSCNGNDMAPEASQGSTTTPPNEISAFTDAQGNGSVEFEIRTSLENASLGCSNTVPCSLVAIPIEGISCKSASETTCNETGAYQPGQSYDGITGGDLPVTPKFWWSASNWKNRFVFPLTMAPPPSVCSLDKTSGKPVPFYGSELLSQAALQWTPAYCLNKKRFNWQDNVMSDDGAFQLMQGGSAAAAEVSGRRSSDTGIAYAPTAVTGWGIAFDIDKPDGTQLESLKLNARLLAKLLTESYPGSAIGAARPGLANNPYSINLDPEFQQLNPGLDTRHASQAAATVLALSTSSDVMESLTSYIASDPAAMAFIHGKADPWGMKVNPAYKNIKLPVSTWPLLDTWKPNSSGSQCLASNPVPYMQLIAEPVSSLRLISQAMIYNWPNVNTVCSYDTGTGVNTIGRVSPQGIGDRFMLGLVDLGDAARSGLPMASLQAAPNHFVAATDSGIEAALRLAKPDGATKPADMSQAAIRKSKVAYPGSMVVYTAAKTSGLPQKTADDVAQFIRVSSTEGQVPGRANGNLAAGYVPIKDSGATKALYEQAQHVASVIEAQKAPATPSSGSSPTGGGTSGTGGAGGGSAVTPGGDLAAPGGVPGDTTPSTGASTAPSAPASESTTSAPTTPTAAISSGVGGSLLPLLLLLGVVAGIGTLLGRVWLWRKGLK